MSDLQREIADRVSNFVSEITRLARQAAMDTLSNALQSEGGRGRGRPAATASAAPRRGRLPKGAKRSPAELEEIVAALHGHIKSNPGQRMEQIKKALGFSTKDLVLPVKKLIEAGAVRAEGQKRSTTYHAGSGDAPKGGRKKRRKK
jgi:hypothetical protein